LSQHFIHYQIRPGVAVMRCRDAVTRRLAKVRAYRG
jgi:hypothetical protein